MPKNFDGFYHRPPPRGHVKAAKRRKVAESHFLCRAVLVRTAWSRCEKQTQILGSYTHFTLNQSKLGNADNMRQRACKGVFWAYQSGIAETPVRVLKNQKVLHGTFPVEGGERTQTVQNSFRRSPGNIQHTHKRVISGVVRSKHARRRHGRSADKTRQRGFLGHLNGSSEKGFTMRARGRTRLRNVFSVNSPNLCRQPFR